MSLSRRIGVEAQYSVLYLHILREGIDNLLEMILLTAEVLELKANLIETQEVS